jgi:hypothetical protein
MSDQPPQFQPGETAVLTEPLRYCERGITAPAGASVAVLFP